MKKIIISRTDSIGDVILTLPIAGVLKQYFPDCQISFIGKKYTRPVIEACKHVDRFLDWDEMSVSSQLPVERNVIASEAKQLHPTKLSLRTKRSNSIQHLQKTRADVIIHVFPVKEICKAAKKAGIPLRIGTSHRWYSWLYNNKLIHFSRKNSELHEAQLNLRMLEPLGIKRSFSLEEIPGYYGLTKVPPFIVVSSFQFPVSSQHPVSSIQHPTSSIQHPVSSIQHPVSSIQHPVSSIQHPASSIQHPVSSIQHPEINRFNLILHPKSKGSAREWGLDNYSRLISLLPEEKFGIIITGTNEEALLMEDFLLQHKNRVTNLTGKLTLSELIGLINHCDGIVAASTGPLHIAAALGKNAIGLYAPMKPIYPKRWAPLGVNADYLVLDKKCNDCRHSLDCTCIRSIKPEDVAEKLFFLYKF